MKKLFVFIIGLIVVGYGIFHAIRFWSEEAIIYMIFLAVFWICGYTFIFFLRPSQRQSYVDNLPEIKEQVKVVFKQDKQETQMVGANNYALHHTYFACFELLDGRQREFEVNCEQYNLISENETGTLTYKEYGDTLIFIDFQA